uniref:OSJNBb0004A17.19 protein n=2 Tax=Oryza sativa subsp. japonica TaxID=39947 RepID=Q4JF18_ORYSJ|nr:OSJNBb0004A17.19 [Oryza sativa Japonica Group]
MKKRPLSSVPPLGCALLGPPSSASLNPPLRPAGQLAGSPLSDGDGTSGDRGSSRAMYIFLALSAALVMETMRRIRSHHGHRHLLKPIAVVTLGEAAGSALPSSLAADPCERGAERRRESCERGRDRRIRTSHHHPRRIRATVGRRDDRIQARRSEAAHGIRAGGEGVAGSAPPVADDGGSAREGGRETMGSRRGGVNPSQYGNALSKKLNAIAGGGMVDLVGNDGFEQEWLLAIYEEVEKDTGKQGEIERTRERESGV